MKRLHVIGHKGVVGGATYELFKRLRYNITGSDKDEPLPPADIYFICVPEKAVAEVVDTLSKIPDIKLGYAPLLVVRSSVWPGTCDSLAAKYGYHICHVPEFLREAVAVIDELSPAKIVVGQCCDLHGKMIMSLFRPLQRRVVMTDPATSELVKLASNNYFSCVISYWNSIKNVADKIGVSSHQVGMIASLDRRISEYGARCHNKFGGRCLPKDIDQLIDFAENIGVDASFFKAIRQVNEVIT